jgi:glycosyltransferase involved in cell wall biosynthesis
MRIAYLTPRFYPEVGGVETHVRRLAERAVGAGHEVDVLTQDLGGRLPGTDRLGDVTIRRFRAMALGRRYPFAPGLWRALRRSDSRYDLLHAQSYHAFPALGALLARGTPLVLTPHYHGPGHSRLGAVLHRPYRLPGRALLQRASAVICVSRSEASLLCAHFPSIAGRVVVIPNGVDAAVAAEPPATAEKVILTVGRLRAYKGVDAILDALALLPSFFLSVVGEGEHLPNLQAHASGIGVADRVRFLGTIGEEELAVEMRSAAVYVSMSSQEAFGLTLADALANRLPVVASDIPAHREVVELAANAHARLIPYDASPELLAEAIRHAVALGRSPLPPRLPSWDAVAQETFEVYERVLRIESSH